MPRLTPAPILRLTQTPARRILLPTATRLFASTDATGKGSQNSQPGWEGRPAEDHAVNRDRHDAQGDASQEGLKKFQEGQDDKTQTASGQAITRKDERNSNQKAKEEHPEAPSPVIGMNSERGGKGY